MIIKKDFKILTLKNVRKTWDEDAGRMMTARNVVIPALAIAGPRSTRALLVLLNLDPVNETIKFPLVMALVLRVHI